MKISFKERPISKKREKEIIPGILYGPGLENVVLEVNSKEFDNIYKEARESSLVSLESSEGSKKYLVLINDIQKDPLSGEIIHIDFYQPNLKKRVEVSVPLIFVGLPPAVKELGGTLVKNFSELEVKALPEKLPNEIKVNVEKLITFEDTITIADLGTIEGVEILKEASEIIALVTPIDIEEETTKPMEEDVESVTKVEKKEKDKIEEEEEETKEK